jgi:hypothetical protein
MSTKDTSSAVTFHRSQYCLLPSCRRMDLPREEELYVEPSSRYNSDGHSTCGSHPTDTTRRDPV